MMSQCLWLALNHFLEFLLKHLGNARMQLLALSAKKGSISRVLHQGMLEEVSRIRRRALAEQQAGRNETVQRRCQFRLPLAYQRSQQRIRKLTQSQPRSARPPWLGRAGRAAP